MFRRYVLRTTDVESAQQFYSEVLDFSLAPPRPGTALAVQALPERARAHGAPAHWLGYAAVENLEAALTRWSACGAERLGPPPSPGTSSAVIRDPFGSVLALSEELAPAELAPVAWHQLHTRQTDEALALYTQELGWAHRDTIASPNLDGGHRLFAWTERGPIVGSVGNTARWPGVHTHWLFYFEVVDLDAAVARVQRADGTAISPVTLEGGRRLAGCEDRQGAAFGLIDAASTAA